MPPHALVDHLGVLKTGGLPVGETADPKHININERLVLVGSSRVWSFGNLPMATVTAEPLRLFAFTKEGDDDDREKQSLQTAGSAAGRTHDQR